MNRHTRWMVVLSGWLLVHPPVAREKAGAYSVHTEAPITEWKGAISFDTAAECEHERDRRVTAFWAATEKTTHPTLSPEQATETLWRCVPSGR